MENNSRKAFRRSDTISCFLSEPLINPRTSGQYTRSQYCAKSSGACNAGRSYTSQGCSVQARTRSSVEGMYVRVRAHGAHTHLGSCSFTAFLCSYHKASAKSHLYNTAHHDIASSMPGKCSGIEKRNTYTIYNKLLDDHQ